MERWAHLSLIWPFKNYCKTLFTPFKLFEFRVQVLVFLKSIAKVPFQSSCAKNIFWNCYEFSFFVWECIALIYYYIIGDLESFLCWCWFFSNKVFSMTFLVTILVIMIIISAKLGNLRCCTRLGLLCMLHKVFCLMLVWELDRGQVKIHLNTPLSLHLSLVWDIYSGCGWIPRPVPAPVCRAGKVPGLHMSSWRQGITAQMLQLC